MKRLSSSFKCQRLTHLRHEGWTAHSNPLTRAGAILSSLALAAMVSYEEATPSGEGDSCSRMEHKLYEKRLNPFHRQRFGTSLCDKQPINENLLANKMYVIGKKCYTDKVTHHEYHNIYNFFLKDLYEKEGSILEIGIGTKTTYSLDMWLKLFPNAFIYGIDIDYDDQGERFTIFKADQSDENQLNAVKDRLKNENVFFINDDGSHMPEHQLLTFNTLFPLLKEGGIYIIEDVETSYWTKGSLYGYPTRYGYKHEKSIVENFKDVADGVNAEFAGEREAKVQHMDSIASITFSRNCIIIVKQEKKDKREYRFKNRL